MPDTRSQVNLLANSNMDRLVKAMDGLKAEMGDLKQEMREMKDLLNAKDLKIQGIETDLQTTNAIVTELRAKVTALEDQLDATEVYERRDTLL